MNAFLLESAAQRRAAFEQLRQSTGLPEASIEKDFWVCWTLSALVQNPEIGGSLTFKGGTSLSKAWGLIERFSEDLDLVVDKSTLGFGGERAPDRASSGKGRSRRLQELRESCQRWVQGIARPWLTERLADTPEADKSRVKTAEDDPDGSTLLVQYPTLIHGDSDAYLRPEVRLEFGARSDVEPQEVRRISSYLHQHQPAVDPDTFCDVRVLAPERTFWEKACLLHEENSRKEPRVRERLSRHLYDLWSMVRHGVAQRALADGALLTRVVAHRRIYFRQGWMKDTAYAPSAFRLVPPLDRMAAWRADFEVMRESMLFGEVPEFDDLLRGIEELEARLRLIDPRPAS